MNARPELTFDGFGINGPDQYRTRLCTFTRVNTMTGTKSEADHYGPMFAESPAMLDVLRGIANDDPLYNDAEEGTFCVHCYAQFSNHKGITHKPECAHERARAILARITP